MLMYWIGGLIVWLGGYGYLKTKDSIGGRPTGIGEVLYVLNGVSANLLAIPHLIVGGFCFGWWTPFIFFVGVGFVTGILHALTRGMLTLLMAIWGVPIGVALSIRAAISS